MRLGAMLGDVARSLFRRPATEKYPFERRAAPQRLRGLLVYDRTTCTGCRLCVMDCPSEAIELITLDRAKKRFVMRYHLDRCTYCAQCVQNCRSKSLEMSDTRWELASLTKEPFTIHYGDAADVEAALALRADAGASASAGAGTKS